LTRHPPQLAKENGRARPLSENPLAIPVRTGLIAGMLLSITTTHRPATDLGYLLAKHPNRFQTFALGFGEAHVIYPEASEERCTASLILDLDPVALVRGRPATDWNGGGVAGPLANYVNDRPYVASSFLSVAIAKVFGSALGGRTTTRPELVAAGLPFSATIGPVRVRGGLAVINRLFDPLGYDVTADPVATTDGSTSHLWMLTIAATIRLQTLLSHLYVLIPVLDDDKHYWVSEDEIEKLLRHGEGWLSEHPDREFITRRYLRRGPRLARQALERLAALDVEPDSIAVEAGPDPATFPAEESPNLNDLRHQTVLRVLQDAGASTVLDLGCGEGKLLRLLLKDNRFAKIIGVDVSMQTLAVAHDRLNVDRLPDRRRERLTLLQSALTYRDRRLVGFDAAALGEVVEHIDPERLPASERCVFAFARPTTVVLTTPNRDWNATIPALGGGKLRHRDHRFEWTRSEFEAWTGRVCAAFGYDVTLQGIGDPDPEFGCPTQMAVFRCH
jgi:3' terminal RNA ribose 2'-O-methyltransferase Hen1